MLWENPGRRRSESARSRGERVDADPRRPIRGSEPVGKTGFPGIDRVAIFFDFCCATALFRSFPSPRVLRAPRRTCAGTGGAAKKGCACALGGTRLPANGRRGLPKAPGHIRSVQALTGLSRAPPALENGSAIKAGAIFIAVPAPGPKGPKKSRSQKRPGYGQSPNAKK